MCGRFSLYEPIRSLVDRFSVEEVAVDDMPARFNVAPTQLVLVVASSSDGTKRKLGTMRWGLVPRWAKDPSIGNRFINARSETVATSRAFRPAFERRRCLIPASGFYEWKKEERGGPKSASKQPFHIHSTDGSPLALAGVWEVWRDAEGQPLRSCTILTTPATSAMSEIHERMPLVLASACWQRWLAPAPLSQEEQIELLHPVHDARLMVDAVSDRVNSSRNDGPDLIEPVLGEGTKGHP